MPICMATIYMYVCVCQDVKLINSQFLIYCITRYVSQPPPSTYNTPSNQIISSLNLLEPSTTSAEAIRNHTDKNSLPEFRKTRKVCMYKYLFSNNNIFI